MLLKQSDFFKGLEVTRTSDKFCFFGNKRLSWNTINKLIEKGEKIVSKFNRNITLDWGNKEDVIEYYNSFMLWSTYISGYPNDFTIFSGVLEVKDNLVGYYNEYYLPSPTAIYKGNNLIWNAKQPDIEDGRYNVNLLKQENAWYARKNSNKGNIDLNIFTLGSKVLSSIKDLKPNSNELWASQYGDAINFNYTASRMDGISFSLTSIDVFKLFRKYFVKQRWSENINIEIRDTEIWKIMHPIEVKITQILQNALERKQIQIDISESYGDLSVSDMLQFNEPIATKVFDLITKQLSKQ